MTALSLEASRRAFTMRFSASGVLTRDSAALIPGGYSRSTFNFGPHAIFVERGDGAHITTVEGHRMLDLNNNFTVNVLGHAHPGISRALMQAIPSGISFGNPGRAEAGLARILIERIPSVQKVQFSCSATESCMSAVRLARAFTGRTRIAKFEGGYHGFSDALHVSSHTQPGDGAGTDSDPAPHADSAGIPESDIGNAIVLVQNDRAGAARMLRAHGHEIACLILELQSGAGGLVALEKDFVEELRALTRELGIVLVFDETISLRAGYHGLQGIYGVTPDLTVMGKIIGGGLPLGAVGGSAGIMKLLENGTVRISGTHHGHKLAVIAGAACMTAMDRNAFERLNALAARIMGELNEWSKARRSPFAMFGNGSSHMAYAWLKAPGLQVKNHRDYWHKVDADKTHILSLELANRGFFPVHRGEISLSVPMTDADIDSFIETVKDIVIEMES